MTKSVLIFFDREPLRRDELDYNPYVQSMTALCHDHRLDDSGIDSLKRIVEVFDLFRPPFRGASDDQISDGLENIGFYMHWIWQTFPEANRPHPERN